MELEIGAGKVDSAMRDADEICVKRKALKAVLEKCQRALELLNETGELWDDDEEEEEDEDEKGSSLSSRGDKETDELCDFLKSRVERPGFLEKIESAQASMSVPQPTPEVGSTWDVVSKNDVWESSEKDEEDYVLVRPEDILEGVACFVATYILSDEQTKDLNPNQLQDALRKIFSLKKKKKGKLRKAWEGSQVIYNVASWSATAIGIYQNPAIIGAASTAFWTSCRVISKLF
ncbi:hypothetical protein AKJ16_DCAP02480 [Drosera capensis]